MAVTHQQHIYTLFFILCFPPNSFYMLKWCTDTISLSDSSISKKAAFPNFTGIHLFRLSHVSIISRMHTCLLHTYSVEAGVFASKSPGTTPYLPAFIPPASSRLRHVIRGTFLLTRHQWSNVSPFYFVIGKLSSSLDALRTDFMLFPHLPWFPSLHGRRLKIWCFGNCWLSVVGTMCSFYLSPQNVRNFLIDWHMPSLRATGLSPHLEIHQWGCFSFCGVWDPPSALRPAYIGCLRVVPTTWARQTVLVLRYGVPVQAALANYSLHSSHF